MGPFEPEGGKTYDPDRVFDLDSISEITVTVPLKEWNSLLDSYDIDSRTRKYIHCDAVLQKGQSIYRIPDSGLRLKGNTSRRRPEGGSGQHHTSGHADWHRCHFMLNFHYYKRDRDHKVLGVQKIHLKYAKEDPTYVRETYTYDLLRRFGVWSAARTSYCKLFLQVEGDAAPVYLGVYLMIESVDDEFIEDRAEQFGGIDGFLWKCRWGSDLRPTGESSFQADDGTPCSKPYELKTGVEDFELAKKQLKDFISKLNTLKGSEFESWIESHCNVDQLLRMYAVYVYVGHWDDYWNNSNNWYMWFTGTDTENYRFHMIGYDYDNVLGTCNECGVQTDAGRQDPYHWGSSDRPLMTKILAIDKYRKTYTSYLKELSSETGTLCGPEASMERIGLWQKEISPYVSNNTGEGCEIKDRPASWSNHREYRIMTDGPDNWFRVKCTSLSLWLSK